jgi:hypothetical protein
MREIKFRGKRLDGRWICGDLWHRPYIQKDDRSAAFLWSKYSPVPSRHLFTLQDNTG